MTIEPKTHHAALDINVMEVKNQKLTILETVKQRAAERHRAVLRPAEEPEREQAVRGEHLGVRRRTAVSAAEIPPDPPVCKGWEEEQPLSVPESSSIRMRAATLLPPFAKGGLGGDFRRLASRCSNPPDGLRRRSNARNPVHDRVPRAHQRRARDRVRHDARHQPRARRVRDARRLHHHRLLPRRHRHLCRDAGDLADRGRPGRPDRRAHDHPLPVRPHDRHHARHLGPEPAADRPGDADLRQLGGQRSCADPGLSARRLPDGRLQPVHHPGHHGAVRRDVGCAQIHARRADRARRDAGSRRGRRRSATTRARST